MPLRGAVGPPSTSGRACRRLTIGAGRGGGRGGNGAWQPSLSKQPPFRGPSSRLKPLPDIDPSFLDVDSVTEDVVLAALASSHAVGLRHVAPTRCGRRPAPLLPPYIPSAPPACRLRPPAASCFPLASPRSTRRASASSGPSPRPCRTTLWTRRPSRGLSPGSRLSLRRQRRWRRRRRGGVVWTLRPSKARGGDVGVTTFPHRRPHQWPHSFPPSTLAPPHTPSKQILRRGRTL